MWDWYSYNLFLSALLLGYFFLSYYDKEKKFGTIVLLTDKDLDAEQTYKAYKCRDRVEKMIDTLKTVLDADVAHMQDQDVFNGWMFCNHLALHWYYMLYNLLVDSNEIKHFSAQSVLTELGYHQIVKVNGEWTTVSIPFKTYFACWQDSVPLPTQNTIYYVQLK